MRAAVFHAGSNHAGNWLAIEDVPVPQPRPGEVLLKVIACGVCRTDLHIVEGDLAPVRPRIIPGHQIVGEVVEGATPELPLGTRAGVSWIGGVDGDCWYCAARPWRTSAIIPSLPATPSTAAMPSTPRSAPISLIRCPKALDAIHVAPLLCAGIIGFRSLRVAGVERGERVGLFGYGSSATLTIAGPALLELRSLRRHAQRSRASRPPRAAGATWVGDENARPPVPLDRAVTFAPAGSVVVSALASLRKGRSGRHQRHPPRPDARLRLRHAALGRTPDPQRGQHDPPGCARLPRPGARCRPAPAGGGLSAGARRTARSPPSSTKPKAGRR